MICGSSNALAGVAIWQRHTGSALCGENPAFSLSVRLVSAKQEAGSIAGQTTRTVHLVQEKRLAGRNVLIWLCKLNAPSG